MAHSEYLIYVKPMTYGLGSSTLNRGRVRLQRKRGSRHTSSWHAPQHNQERRIVMDPTTVFCPNLACPARGQTGQGNIGIHSQKEKRFICTACRKTFATTKGTVLYRGALEKWGTLRCLLSGLYERLGRLTFLG